MHFKLLYAKASFIYLISYYLLILLYSTNKFNFYPKFNIIPTERILGRISVEAIPGQSSTFIIYITLGLIGLILILIASLAAFNHIRSNKLRNRQR